MEREAGVMERKKAGVELDFNLATRRKMCTSFCAKHEFVVKCNLPT